MSYFPTDIPFMSDDELIENGLKKPYKKPEIIDSKDVIPVIRCKNCKFYTSMRSDIKTGICNLNMHHMGDDGFCSCGERRKE